MKLSFKKIASVLTSAVMLSSTVALGAAASYPAPFVKNGEANVAVIYGGANAANTDLAAVMDITSNLNDVLVSQTAPSTTTGGVTVTTSDEVAPLFTGSSKIYNNDSLNGVVSVLTDKELPSVLQDGTFSGNVEAKTTQTIVLGSSPYVTFAEQPSSDDDPQFGLALQTSTSYPVYNATVTFNKAVNMSHADSKGAELELFGQKFTVASSTDATDLVLFKAAEKVSLVEGEDPVTVNVGGNEYTLELISASDTAATVKVTNSDGTSDSKEINEDASKKVNGLTVAVTAADETNSKLSATVIAGAEKVTLTSGAEVKVGEEDSVVDGTMVEFTGGLTALTKIQVSVAATSSDKDAILPGESLVDPVFGSFKLDFASLNIPRNDSANRETIKVSNTGDDRMSVTLTDRSGNEKTIQFAKNWSSGIALQHDNDGRNISVMEKEALYKNDMALVGNEAEGRLVKLSTLTNSTTGFSSDRVTFTDVFSGDTYDTTISQEGTGTVTIGGKNYDVTYVGTSTDETTRYVRLNYPDSTTSATAIAYPTLKTSKGALFSFYEPLTINISNWDGAGTDLTTLKIPDGDGYTDVTLALVGGQNFTVDSTLINSTNGASKSVTVGKLTYNFTYSAPETTTIYLVEPDGGNMMDPGIVMFEERDDNSEYQALVVTLEAGATSDDGIGVDEVMRTWSNDAQGNEIALSSDSKVYEEADLYGAVITKDTGDSDQATATISYPDEQIYALLYVAEQGASIQTSSSGSTGGTGAKTLGSVSYMDSEVASAAGKNLIVVGGSCVNTYAATLLGSTSPVCGEGFETKTGVGAGSYLIQTFAQDDGTVATLVAGYNAGDTTNAAKFLTTQNVMVEAGKKYVGTSATSAELVSTETASDM